MLKYQESILLSKSKAEEVSKSGDLKAICNMLIGLHRIDDFEWAQDFLLSHLNVDSLDVNRSAIYGLASLARVHRKMIEISLGVQCLKCPVRGVVFWLELFKMQ